MDPLKNPYFPAAGAPPPELVGWFPPKLWTKIQKAKMYLFIIFPL